MLYDPKANAKLSSKAPLGANPRADAKLSSKAPLGANPRADAKLSSGIKSMVPMNASTGKKGGKIARKPLIQANSNGSVGS